MILCINLIILTTHLSFSFTSNMMPLRSHLLGNLLVWFSIKTWSPCRNGGTISECSLKYHTVWAYLVLSASPISSQAFLHFSFILGFLNDMMSFSKYWRLSRNSLPKRICAGDILEPGSYIFLWVCLCSVLMFEMRMYPDKLLFANWTSFFQGHDAYTLIAGVDLKNWIFNFYVREFAKWRWI